MQNSQIEGGSRPAQTAQKHVFTTLPITRDEVKTTISNLLFILPDLITNTDCINDDLWPAVEAVGHAIIQFRKLLVCMEEDL